jgi:Flp pilus assembly protein TadD
VLAAGKQWVPAERAFKQAQKLDPSDPRPKVNLEELKALREQSPL